MKQILCPVDFSESSQHTVRYAASLARESHAKLTLLNIQSIVSLPPAEVIKGKFLATEPAREQLEELSYQIMKEFKITCLSEVEPSNKRVSDLIADRSLEFDLIIMGTHGASDLFEYLFGSRSYQVAKESSTPILLIPQSCEYQNITSIVFAFDYEREQRLPIAQLTTWAKLLAARITVLQVKEHYTREAEVNTLEIQRSIQTDKDLLDMQFETHYSDDVISSIDSFVLRNKADALALCSIDHSILKTFFHESVIKTLSFTATYPIFVFHE
jgi:nucleotide-binding universal stress UspA family protein